MIKRIAIICILLLPALLGYSIGGKVYGTVKDDNGKPIESCVIKAVNSNHATYSNKHGEFSLEYNADSSHALIFFGLGYETKEVSISTDTLEVVLKRKVNMLKDAVVSADYDRGKIRRAMMGKKSLKPHGICTGHTGQEWAIFLGADSTRHGLLENVYFYITKEGLPASRFRVHVYDIDTGYLPGTDLLDSTVILHANAGDEWVSADISARQIPVGRGVFISMEWIAGYGNDLKLVTSKKYPAQPAFNGQVLAYTEGYHKQASLSYVRKNANAQWKYIFMAGSMRKNILNPMAYATYTYYKK